MSSDPDRDLRARAWSRYWSGDVRHSCPGSFHGHYGSATEAFWRGRFQRIREGHRVLEVGCGNGSLVRLLDHAGPDARPREYHAVDAAHLNTRWIETLSDDLRSRMRMHATTPIQQLPLPDRSIDHVYSQYALEYCADAQAWAELARVLAPAATFAAIVHHRESHLARVAACERDHCDWLLRDDGVLTRAERILPFVAAASDPGGTPAGAAADTERSAFNAELAELSRRVHTGQFTDVLDETAQRIMRVLQNARAAGAALAQSRLRQVREGLDDHRLRVGELVAHAVDRRDLAAWTERLQAIGLATAEIGEIREESYLLGWTITAE